MDKSNSLFKYTPKKYLDAFFEKGSLKIGHLYEYQDVEKHGEIIGDQEEGREMTMLTFADCEIDEPKLNFLSEYIGLDLNKLKKEKNLTFDFRGATFLCNNVSPDYYIYCVTSEFNLEVMEKFNSDSCIEILDPKSFFDVISEKIKDKAIFKGFGEIKYRSKKTMYDDLSPEEISPVILKDPSFSYQKEWRAVWEPIDKELMLSPMFIDVPEVIQYCRIHHCPK